MLNSLEDPKFFTLAEIVQLRNLGLWQDSHTTPSKLAFAGLLLAPVMQIVMRDNATSGSEFEVVQQYVKVIEWQFELAAASDLESIGTDMGLLPMLPGNWDEPRFLEARALLAQVMQRLTESEAHAVRNEISKAALSAARAGSPHFINMHMVDEGERNLIRQLIRDLQLQKSAEGLNLVDKSGN